MQSASINPVERRLRVLQQLWLQATKTSQAKVFIWEMEDDAVSLLDTFLAAQKQRCDYNTQDMFIRFNHGYDDPFGYSRVLKQELIARYTATKSLFCEKNIAAEWAYADLAKHDSSSAFLAYLHSFANYYQANFRYLVVAITPEKVLNQKSLLSWLESAIENPIPNNVRIMLIQPRSCPRWQPLVKKYAAQVEVIRPQISNYAVIQETVVESIGSSENVLYKHYLSDLMILLVKGTPQQVAERAKRALAIATQQKWFEQQVVVQTIVASAWSQVNNLKSAVANYQLARQSAQQIEEPAIKHNLVTQSLIGEAKAWKAGKKYQEAATCYLKAAAEAKQMPNALFVIESLRLAGDCYIELDNKQQAVRCYIDALKEGKIIKPEEREMTTLNYVLYELLCLQDKFRAEELKACGDRYQSKLQSIQNSVDVQAQKLGKAPDPIYVAKIELEMEQSMEDAFFACHHERESIIQQSGDNFIKVVNIGRELLNPTWNGHPSIAHPLHKEDKVWAEPPSYISCGADITQELAQVYDLETD